MTDENEVGAAAANEKVCPEFNSDSHSKEVKIILYVKIILRVNVLIAGFIRRVIHYFRLRKEKSVLSEVYATEIFVILPSVHFSKHAVLFLKCHSLK